MKQIEIRKFRQEDKSCILKMMKEFYTSDAVFTNGSDKIYNADFDECLNNSPYLEGYTLSENQNIIGYAMIAKSYSTEFGKHCIWLEDLYLLESYRGQGIIPQFFEYIEKQYPNTVLRLEAERENTHATHVYKKHGFSELPYLEMKKEI